MLFSSIILKGEGPWCWKTEVTLRGCRMDEVMESMVVPRSSFLRTALYMLRSLLSSMLAAVGLLGLVELTPLMLGLLLAVFALFVLLLLLLLPPLFCGFWGTAAGGVVTLFVGGLGVFVLAACVPVSVPPGRVGRPVIKQPLASRGRRAGARFSLSFE